MLAAHPLISLPVCFLIKSEPEIIEEVKLRVVSSIIAFVRACFKNPLAAASVRGPTAKPVLRVAERAGKQQAFVCVGLRPKSAGPSLSWNLHFENKFPAIIRPLAQIARSTR